MTGQSNSASYVPEIDALRCFAMTGVVAQHCGIFPIGWVGVWLFFVISGFVITRSVLGRGGETDSLGKRVRTFFRKRAYRILPLYLAYLFICVILAHILGYDDVLESIPYLMTFTYNISGAFDPGAKLVPHLWSISGEEQFYLTFPLLFFGISRRAFVGVMVALIILSPVGRVLLQVLLSSGGLSGARVADLVYVATPLHFDAFAGGVLLALWSEGRSIGRTAGLAGLAGGAGMLILVIAIYVTIQSLSLGGFQLAAFKDILTGDVIGSGREALVYSGIWIAAAGLVLAVLARAPIITPLCRLPSLQAIGRISYGGYVYHGLAMIVVSLIAVRVAPGLHLANAAYFALVYALTIAMAALSYRLFELPLIRWSRSRSSHTDSLMAGNPATLLK